MEKRNTTLYIIFITSVLCLLVAINFFKDSIYIAILGNALIFSISILIIIIVNLLTIYREVENNKRLNQFFTILTHKIKTPLTGIRWSIDVLQRDITLTERKDMLLEMQKANQRLMEIIDLLVGFAKFDKKLDYTFELVSLREVIGASMNKNSTMATNKKINITIISDREVPQVMADKLKIQFAVDMVIDNALKYTPIGGAINISFENNDNSVTLKINDTGIGMSFFDSKRVFKRFFRSKSAREVDFTGLGLGLYTAKKIVEHHDGKLWAESKGLNKGSTFYIKLPIKR